MRMISLLCIFALRSETTFTQMWSVRLQTEIQSVVVGERSIFFGTNNSFGAIDQATGKKVWAKSVALPQLGVYIAEGDGVLYASVGQGSLWAYNSASGKQMWTAKRDGYSSPIGAYNGAVYAEMTPGKLSALSAGTGKPMWTADLLNSSPSAKPIRYGKSILVGTKLGTVFSFDKDSGKQAWKFEKGNASCRAILVGDEGRPVVFFDDGAVICLSNVTGQRMWAYYSNNGIFGTPLYQDGRVFLTSASGNFICLAGLNGQELWKRKLSPRQNFGLSQPLPWRAGYLLADRTKLAYLNAEGERQWESDLGEDLFGQQPRALGGDLLLSSSHAIMRYHPSDAE
ncbi:MAG: hypothetical protein BGO01_02930 [Armatimonadetes bacterium 55-13]|nr:PQQ-binding-like beta-propeller repeat protein [Armatimonadota bacterium]OJU63613.1 MAG: hypothetical protein BGO01_02930 [Armatimonadetes bacterium 55-13]